jgi:hypothetical protein
MDATKRTGVDALPGGRYQWVDNGDGTFNVLNVPILSEIPAGGFPHPKNSDAIDRAWMERAIAKAQQREAEGHIGAVHIHHHGTGEVQLAGRLLLDHIGRMTYDGKERDTLFAHLLRVPREVFDEIRNGKLPYRSIEGEPWSKCEITSLALMPTETPYFRLPMLTLGDELRPQILSLALDKRYAVACSVSGFATKAQEDNMPDEKKPDEVVKAELPKPLPDRNDPSNGPAEPAGKKPFADANGDQPKPKSGGVSSKVKDILVQMMGLVLSAIGEEVPDKADEKKADKKPGEQPTSPVAQAAPKPEETPKAEVKSDVKAEEAPKAEASPKIPEELSKVCPLCRPIIEAWYRGCGGKPGAEAEVPVKAAAVTAELETIKVKLAERDAEVLTLKAKIDNAAKVDEVAADLASAEKALVGHYLTPLVKAEMRRTRETGGKACLDAFVRVFASTPPDPPSSLEAAVKPAVQAGAAPAPATSEEESILNSLGAVGPEIMARARHHIALGQEWCKTSRGLTLAEFVKSNLKAEGFIKS